MHHWRGGRTLDYLGKSADHQQCRLTTGLQETAHAGEHRFREAGLMFGFQRSAHVIPAFGIPG
jgi:hypothetical protein